jgi:hypothetical protein
MNIFYIFSYLSVTQEPFPHDIYLKINRLDFCKVWSYACEYEALVAEFGTITNYHNNAWKSGKWVPILPEARLLQNRESFLSSFFSKNIQTVGR